MAYVFDNNNSLRSMYERINPDGTIDIRARAHGALTAKTPYLVYIGYDGPKTAALFDTGLASTTAAAELGLYKVGVPDDAVSSDTDGWLQIGGYCGSVTTASITSSQGTYLLWTDAAVSNAGSIVPTTTGGSANAFAVGYTAASATTSHNIYLLNRYVMGIT